MSIWDTILTDISIGEKVVADGVIFVRAAIAGAPVASKGGTAGDVLRAIEVAVPQALPLLETLAASLVPGGGLAIEALAFLISHDKGATMTQEEINAWMAYTSRPNDGAAG